MYDVVIIVSGPAGYTAALYSVRYKLKTLVISMQEGGQAGVAHDIENYPGFVSIKGPELMQKFKESAVAYGTETKMDEVHSISKNEDGTFSLQLTYSGESIQTKAVLLTMGTKNRKLNAKREDEMYGKGVTYCATCDGFFFKDKPVALVGGGDSAATAALYMSELCPMVYLLVRKDKMIAEPLWQEQLNAKENIEILYNTEVDEFLGENALEGIRTTEGKEIVVEGCFIEIGANPNTALVDQFSVQKDDMGYLEVNKDQSIPGYPGLFAAGDITTGSNHFHQIATAVGEGAVASNSIFDYISRGGK